MQKMSVVGLYDQGFYSVSVDGDDTSAHYVRLQLIVVMFNVPFLRRIRCFYYEEKKYTKNCYNC